MSSYHEPFMVFPRTLKSGKKVFYYQVYLSNGKRTNPKSTGQCSKGAARAFCRQLEKDNKLIPVDPRQKLIFKEYFENWWEWGPNPDVPSLCPYLVRRYLRNNKPSYAHSRITLSKYKKHILPFFGEMDITEIRVKHIEKWLDVLAIHGLCGKTQIGMLSTLRIMMGEARRLEDIEFNPVQGVIPPRKNKAKKRGIPEVEETKELFDMERIDEIWNGDYQAMGFYLLARDTAMRPGEVRAIQRKHIHFHNTGECTVDIMQAVDHVSHRIKETKTGAIILGVPVRSDTAGILRKICQMYDDPENLLFSKDGIVHVPEQCMKRRLYKAMRAIGISEEERKERNITPYSFRYLAITRLKQSGVSDIAIRSLARHKTPIMTDGYTIFDDKESINQIRDFYQHQKNVSGGF